MICCLYQPGSRISLSDSTSESGTTEKPVRPSEPMRSSPRRGWSVTRYTLRRYGTYAARFHRHCRVIAKSRWLATTITSRVLEVGLSAGVEGRPAGPEPTPVHPGLFFIPVYLSRSE